MYNSYFIFPKAQDFPVSKFAAMLSNLDYIFPHPREQNVFLICENSAAAARLRRELIDDPAKRIPSYVGVIYLSPRKIDVGQEATLDTLELMRPIVATIIASVPCEVVDQEGRPISGTPERDLLSVLFPD